MNCMLYFTQNCFLILYNMDVKFSCLVHIIPNKQIVSRSAISVKPKILCPPSLGFRVRVIYPGRTPWPTPPIEYRIIGFLDQEITILGFFIYMVAIVSFQVRIYDCHCLYSIRIRCSVLNKCQCFIIGIYHSNLFL